MKNALENNSVCELQDVDYRSEDEQANDAIIRTAIDVLGNSRLQNARMLCAACKISSPADAQMS